MKKLIVMLMLTLFSIGAYAQTQQGQSSFGFNQGNPDIRIIRNHSA